MALSQSSRVVKRGLVLLEASERTWLQAPLLRLDVTRSGGPLAAYRSFGTSPSLYKKRTIAAAPDSPKRAETPTKGGKGKGGKDKSGGRPAKEEDSSDASNDLLDMDRLWESFTSQDAAYKEKMDTLSQGRFSSITIGKLPITIKDEAADPADTTATRTFPLSELAQVVNRHKTRTVSIFVNDRAYVKPVMSAVQASPDYNQQPQRAEDNELELVLKVEAERAGGAASRFVKEGAMEWREHVRQVRRRHDKALKDAGKQGSLLPDVVRAAEKEMKKLHDKKMKEIDAEEERLLKKMERGQ